MGNTILQNIFAKNLPTDLSAGLRQSLLSTFEIPTSLDAQTTASIRAACKLNESLLADHVRYDGPARCVYLFHPSGRHLFGDVRVYQGKSAANVQHNQRANCAGPAIGLAKAHSAEAFRRLLADGKPLNLADSSGSRVGNKFER